MLIADRSALLGAPIMDVPFVLLDIESTGLKPEEDRICEIALMRWQHGQIVHTFEALVSSARPIAPDAYAVNGISADMLAGAPEFELIMAPLLDAIGDGVLVAHNAPFDVCFLNAELVRAGQRPLNNVVVDTLSLARHFLRRDRYNLGALAQHVGVARPQHRAMSDVEALLAVFAHLLRQLEPLGVETLEDLLRAQGGLLPGDLEPAADPMVLEALRQGRQLRIAYRTKGGDPILRTILPLELHMADGLPRVIAYCFLRNSQRTFYLDRIAEMMLVDEG